MVENEEIAERLDHLNKLHRDRDEVFKANSYSKAAKTIREHDGRIEDISEENLKDLQGVGDAIASKIREFVETGKIQKVKELESK